MKLSQNDLRELDEMIAEDQWTQWREWLKFKGIGWSYKTDPHHGGKVVDYNRGRFIKDFYYERDGTTYHFENLVGDRDE